MRILTTDFVTNVDLTVHNTLRGQLFQLAPAVQFLGEEAGGRVTTPRGAPLSLLEGSGVLASNGQLHPALMDALNEQERYQWNCALPSHPGN